MFHWSMTMTYLIVSTMFAGLVDVFLGCSDSLLQCSSLRQSCRQGTAQSASCSVGVDGMDIGGRQFQQLPLLIVIEYVRKKVTRLMTTLQPYRSVRSEERRVGKE